MILPGFPIPMISNGAQTFVGDFSIIAGAEFGGSLVGYLNSDVGNFFYFGPIGSAAGNLSADGGTVGGLISDNGNEGLFVDGGSQGLSSINIDGTEYTLSLNQAVSGLDIYAFSAPDFVDGQTYQITVT